MFFLRTLPNRETLERYGARFDEMDVDLVEDALHQLRRASVLMREIDAYFLGRGLSQTRFIVLMVLHREPDADGLPLSAIAERMDVSRPVVTTTVRALEGQGLVSLARSSGDGRSRIVTLTEEGRTTVRDTLPGYYRTISANWEIER